MVVVVVGVKERGVVMGLLISVSSQPVKAIQAERSKIENCVCVCVSVCERERVCVFTCFREEKKLV